MPAEQGHSAALIGFADARDHCASETGRETPVDSQDPEKSDRSDRLDFPHHGPFEPISDLRSRVAIGAHALLISLAAGAVTSLLSGVFSAF